MDLVEIFLRGEFGGFRFRGVFGAIAQLVERVVRNDEVRGSIPLCSTSIYLQGDACIESLGQVQDAVLVCPNIGARSSGKDVS